MKGKGSCLVNAALVASCPEEARSSSKASNSACRVACDRPYLRDSGRSALQRQAHWRARRTLRLSLVLLLPAATTCPFLTRTHLHRARAETLSLAGSTSWLICQTSSPYWYLLPIQCLLCLHVMAVLYTGDFLAGSTAPLGACNDVPAQEPEA